MRKDLCICFDRKYIPYAAVTIKSVVDHAKPDDDLHFHVLCDGEALRLIAPLRQIACNLHVYNTDEYDLSELPVTAEWSMAAWARCLIPDMLPGIDKILYLDCDVIVNSTLDGLFEIDMTNYAIAGCVDPQSYGPGANKRLGLKGNNIYVCSGVLLMNLDYWRAHAIKEKIIDQAIRMNGIFEFPDQDAINLVCADSKLVLNPKYGVMPSNFICDGFLRQYANDIPMLLEAPEIIHYAGYQPWHFEKNKSPHSRLWWDTFKSLKKYPEVYKRYFMTIVKYLVKASLCRLSIIGKDSKYSTNQYYNHPKITPKRVLRQLNSLQA